MRHSIISTTIIGLILAMSWITSGGGRRMSKIDYSADFANPKEKMFVRAVADGNTGPVKQLAAQGVNLNAIGAYENTPLRVALQTGRLESVICLLRLGASPNFRTPAGVAAAKVAITAQENPEFLQVLLDYGLDPNLKSENVPLIFFAVSEGRWQHYDILLAKGADVNSRNENGSSLLLDLVMQMEYDRAKDLLLKGADFGVKSMHGLNVLDELVDYQRRLCIDPDLPDCRKRAELLRLLQERGASVPQDLPYM